MSVPEVGTPISKDVDAYNAYYAASLTATKLRSMITMGGAGSTKANKRILLNQLKQQFDFLYFLTMDNKDIDNELIKNVDEWLSSTLTVNDKTMLHFCGLFKQYKSELFKVGVI